MLPAHVAFRRLLGGTAGKLGAACAMLAAVASIVLVSGGSGIFGPLGSFIAGHGARTATEAAASTGAAGSASSPIVAAPAGSAVGQVGGGGPASDRRGGSGGPTGRRPPGGGRAPGGGPQGGLPGFPDGGGGGVGGGSGPAPGGPPGNPAPSRPPSQVAQAVDSTGSAVEQIGHQAPAVQPVTDTVGRLTHQVADTCRRLAVCP